MIAWAEKFKMEQVESTSAPTSWVLDFLHRSRGVALFRKRAIAPLREQLVRYFGHHKSQESADESKPAMWLWRTVGLVALGAIGYAVVRVILILIGLHAADFRQIGIGLFATWLRVNLTLILGALWTIPVGVAIGFNPRLARIAQPLAQIAASVPATAVFPVVLLLLIRFGGGLGLGSIVLLLLGTQWYILFNVIAGAMAIPTDLKEAASVFGIRGWERWRKLILPGIFPFLVTGMITASGGAWNVSIVAEYAHLKGQTYSTVGVGCHDFRRHRRQEFQSPASQHDCPRRRSSNHQSPGLAQTLSSRRNSLQTGKLIPSSSLLKNSGFLHEREGHEFHSCHND